MQLYRGQNFLNTGYAYVVGLENHVLNHGLRPVGLKMVIISETAQTIR